MVHYFGSTFNKFLNELIYPRLDEIFITSPLYIYIHMYILSPLYKYKCSKSAPPLHIYRNLIPTTFTPMDFHHMLGFGCFFLGGEERSDRFDDTLIIKSSFACVFVLIFQTRFLFVLDELLTPRPTKKILIFRKTTQKSRNISMVIITVHFIHIFLSESRNGIKSH